MHFDDARHLLRRAGYRTRTADVQPLLGMSRSAAVAHVTDTARNPVVDYMPPALGTDEGVWRHATTVGNWMLERWKNVSCPFEEKLLFFFHGHFATSANKLRYGHHLWDHLTTIRSQVMGHYPSLVRTIATGAPMLLYLDNHKNTAGSPNENLARELLELHTLGRGNYSEYDVVECARAWTGYGVNDGKHYSEFHARDHDDRPKTIFGITRSWNGPWVIDHIFHNTTLRMTAARHLARRMWEFFAYPDPSDSLVDSLASAFVAGGMQVRALVKAMFECDDFYSPQAKQGLVRSPFEFVVDCLRCTGAGTDVARPEWYLDRMGHRPFYPPTPKGWGHNDTWLTATTTLAKGDFVRHLTWKVDDWPVLAPIETMSVAAAVDHALDMFGIPEPSSRTRTVLQDHLVADRSERSWHEIPGMLTMTMLVPEFQLA